MSGIELALAIAGIAISVPAIIELAIKQWNIAAGRLKALETADLSLSREISRISESQTNDILLFFKLHSDALPPSFKAELQSLFQVLRNLTQDLEALLPASPKSVSSKNMKRIKEVVKSMEEWNSRLLKRAIVFLFFGNLGGFAPRSEAEGVIRSSQALATVDRLRTAVQSTYREGSGGPPSKLLLDEHLIPKSRVQIPHSSLWLSGPSGPAGTTALVEYRQYSDSADTSTINSIRKIVREIASVLHEADPATMSILTCRGFFQDRLNNRFELHFAIPEGQENPRSLRGLLSDPINKSHGKMHTLNHRLNLAKKVASAVFFVHSGDFVHKNIRPENFFIFEPTANIPESAKKPLQFPRSIGNAYLAGYDGIRKVDAASNRIRIEDWKQNIYLSPVRHRLNIGDEYKTQHDVYSLGVVLLEIALWTSLTSRSGVGKELWTDSRNIKAPVELQQTFINIARRNVPQAMGQRFADVVVACLEELRQDEEQGVLEDQDGIVVELAYITEVMNKLEEIVM